MTYLNDFPDGLIVNPTKVAPYQTIKVDETIVAFDCVDKLCKIGRIVSLEGVDTDVYSIEAIIHTGEKEYRRNIMHDIDTGKAYVIDPYISKNFKEVK